MAKKPDYISDIRAKYNAALENQREKFKKFNDFEYIYHSKLKKYDPNIPSRVFNPIVWSFIETIVTRMLAKKPTIAFKPRESMDKEQSELWSALFEYWFDKAEAMPKMAEFIKQALIYGTSILKVTWKSSPPRQVISYQTDPITGEAVVDPMTGNFATNVQEVIDFDDPNLENVNIYDFFVDPTATSMESAKWVIHQYRTTISDAEQVPYYDKAALKRLKTEEANLSGDQEQFEQARREAAGYTNEPIKSAPGEVIIWEYWEDDKLCVIGNGYVQLFEGKNPYWHGKKPFMRYVDSINPLDFYGKGEIEPIEKMVHALNTLINQRITNINQILNPIWKSRPNVDDTELQFLPNTVIHVNDMNDVDTLAPKDVTASNFQEQSVIVETIQRALGVTDYVQGLQTPGQTAAEVEIKTSQANARFSHKIMMFEEMALKQLGEFVYQLYQQFITTEKVVRILGADGEKLVRLTPADLVGMFDVIPESGSTLEVDSEAEFRKFVNVYGMMQGKPWINQMELDKEIFEQSGEKDPERFFLNDGGGINDILGAVPGFGQGNPAETLGAAQGPVGMV